MNYFSATGLEKIYHADVEDLVPIDSLYQLSTSARFYKSISAKIANFGAVYFRPKYAKEAKLNDVKGDKRLH